ncbi:MAG: hypothetical protein ABJH98_14100 [Reichenbachiella sp.]|uniref:hypothetical protein n=1 Tax=Reichenbachiella sp. TaxID=2184521 RepID=UPI003299FDA2
MKSLAAFFLIVIFITSCNDQSAIPIEDALTKADAEYIIFGHFYGFCLGEECIEIFKLTPNAIFEDANDLYPSSQSVYESEFIKLDQSIFERLKESKIEIPSELLNEKATIIGAPDAADGGGIYLELPNGDFWLLDMNQEYLPEYLHSLRDEIRSAISLINE